MFTTRLPRTRLVPPRSAQGRKEADRQALFIVVGVGTQVSELWLAAGVPAVVFADSGRPVCAL